jgi:hypothetical protein
MGRSESKKFRSVPGRKADVEDRARRLAVRLLSGAGPVREETVRRLRDLVERSPGAAEAIHRRILHELGGGEDEADEETPQCADPPLEIGDLERDWEQFAVHVRAAELEGGDKALPRLILFPSGWQLVNGPSEQAEVLARPSAVLLKEWLVEPAAPMFAGLRDLGTTEQGRSEGGRPGPAGGLRSAVATARLELPELAAAVRLAIELEQPDPSRGESWRLAFELEKKGELSPLMLALGDAQRPTTGWRTLVAEARVWFEVDPPIERTWWVWIAWLEGDQRKRRAAELRILRAPEGHGR